MTRLLPAVACLVLCARLAAAAPSLHLIPTPSQVTLGQERFTFTPATRLCLGRPQDAQDLFAAGQLVEEVHASFGFRPSISSPVRDGKSHVLIVRLGRDDDAEAALERLNLRMPDKLNGPYARDRLDQGYVLSVEPGGVLLAARSARGAYYGVQTLRQLVRANASEKSIPACRIVDYPGLAYRCWQLDVSRGPIPTLDFLKRTVRELSAMKLNAMTMYTEHVFKNPKHPKIAPSDGITADEARELCAYAKRYHVEVLGNHQAFGHYAKTLRLPEYAHLGENGSVLSPAREGTYALLKDIFDVIAPAFDSPLFVINCDETYGLGEGPAKDMAKTMGIGGLYAYHINRLADLLKPHRKTPLMWGDIALHHRDIVPRLPKDLIVLSWAYDARPLWDAQIVPFTELGFRFWVCPGVSSWVWIWPDHRTAVTNISNYVRDGVRHGAMGMLNTTWGDDGEQLFGYTWFPQIWAGEVAWRPALPAVAASSPDTAATKPDADWLKQAEAERESRLEAFNQAFPRLFLGIDDDAVSRFVWTIEDVRKSPLLGGLRDQAYWQDPLALPRLSAGRIETLAQEAIDKLNAVSLSTIAPRFNADYVRHTVLARERILTVLQRQILLARMRQGYAKAADRPAEAAKVLRETADKLAGLGASVQHTHELYRELWAKENRSDWLKTVSARYESLHARIEAARKQLTDGAAMLEKKEVWPDAVKLGLVAPPPPGRAVAPAALPPDKKLSAIAWHVSNATWRQAIVWDAGKRDRQDVPLEVVLAAPAKLPPGARFALTELKADGSQESLPAQIDRLAGGKLGLAAIAPGLTRAGQRRTFFLYAGPVDATDPFSARSEQAVRATPDGQGGFWIENAFYRARLMREGAHLYEFHLKALKGRDVTIPGRSAHHGFSDLGRSERAAKFELTLEADGPLLVRARCVSPDGVEKRMTFWANRSWFEVALDRPVGYYWDFDDDALMSAGSATPGRATFSDGHQADVGKAGELSLARPGTTWGFKRREDGLTLALITPGAGCTHRVGPGGGMGGVGVEGGGEAQHFVTLCDVIGDDPAGRCRSLDATLDLRSPPKVFAPPAEEKP
ncbi:MAG: O-GlcNAcase NagJ precursor [Planctomycetes bacterium ADurb.Bin126]|nr:MAG: O-GlcNAcase NagJ precursor [Planctomycetes bacterium ADurb.Bin126]HOD82459.1 glycoside hydrolase family 20 zincin-like fold domain-containing protein [Phycisphaerae bacterium]HQL73010.1 glycoside hydrolase family 20 zincin-like fold domain-containing protein [Phycisphaerae bacterium]